MSTNNESPLSRAWHPNGNVVYCWYESHDNRHREVMTGTLKRLVQHVEKGNKFESRGDVPENIRREIYAVEQRKLDRHHRSTNAQHPPIHITNVIPSNTSTSSNSFNTELASSSQTSGTTSTGRLIIPGPRDVALKNYIIYQQSRVEDEVCKSQIAMVGEALLKARWDLERVH